MLAHWDEVESRHAEAGHISGRWTGLGRAAGTKTIGVNRVQVDAGKWSTPLHRETVEEEIFFVLAGSGVSLQDDKAYEVRPGDCIVHRARAETHTLRAGEDGLDYLVFSNRSPTQIAVLPRAGVSWVGGLWAELGAGDRPWEREAAVGPPDVPELSERPASIVNVADVEGEYEGRWKSLAAAAGSEQTGLNWARLEAGEEGAPPHLHSADEELYVILDGEGELELWPSPQLVRNGRELERHPIRAGHVLAFPPGGGMGHGLRAGEAGLTYLAYGTRDPSDICYYPRSNKIFFRGLGLIARLEDLDYDDGD